MPMHPRPSSGTVRPWPSVRCLIVLRLSSPAPGRHLTGQRSYEWARSIRGATRSAAGLASGAGLAAGPLAVVAVAGSGLGRRQAGLERVGQAAATDLHLGLWLDY